MIECGKTSGAPRSSGFLSRVLKGPFMSKVIRYLVAESGLDLDF